MIERAIKKSYDRACQFPRLAWVEAITVDRYVKSVTKSPSLLTFTRAGISPRINSKFLKKATTTRNLNTLQKLSKLNIDKQNTAICFFNEAGGIEVDALNLLFADQLLQEEIVWKYFFNKYLRIRDGWPISLLHASTTNIFDRFIGSAKPAEKKHGPLVSVIMPVFNNEKEIDYATRSILNQDYANIELLIVDDASSDNTGKKCQSIAKSDSRVRYLRNKINAGAYVSRNRALRIAKGDYITVMDGDDWSFPERISYQLSQLQKQKKAKAHLGYYLRLTSEGSTTAHKIIGIFSHDGVLHKCLPTLFIERHFMLENLGFWDSVRYGADSELYFRLRRLDPELIVEETVPLMLALDRSGSLTKQTSSVLGGPNRKAYAEQFTQWHEQANTDQLKLSFPLKSREFSAPDEMCSRYSDVATILAEDM